MSTDKLKIPSSRLLAVRRAAMNETVVGMARRIGISRSYLHRVESRQCTPSREVIELMAEHYGVRVEYLEKWISEGEQSR